MPRPKPAPSPDLGAVYALALERPDLVEQVVAARARWPEVAEVLQGSVDTLWRAILTPGEVDPAPPALDPEQKRWLLLHAGLLRGLNLALITAWRPTGDDLATVDALYPGFVAHADALHASPTSPGFDPVALLEPAGRAGVHRATAAARSQLEASLRRGYGLGFLLDARLSGASPARRAAAERLAREAAGQGDGDDPTAVAAARGLAHQLDRAGRARTLAALLAEAPRRRALEAHLAAVSRARPLAVPAGLARFSPAYVCTLLAYLVGWWLTAGQRLGLGEVQATPGARPLAELGRRCSVRAWLLEQAHVWARGEVADVLAVADDAPALRWRLAQLAQEMTAVGWELARGLVRG